MVRVASDFTWTGKAPDRCPGFDTDGTLRALSAPDTSDCTRSQVLDYFDNGWTLTELLFSALVHEGRDVDEAFRQTPAHGLRHPLVFYYGHPAVFYVNKLRVAGLISAGLEPEYERLFEVGVDEMRWDDMSRPAQHWPAVSALRDYRAKVYALVRGVLERHEGLAAGHAPILRGHPLWALFMAFEHERIHLETSSVLLRELPSRWVARPAAWVPPHPTARPLDAASEHGAAPQAGRDYPVNELLAQAGGRVVVGKPADHPSYGWDNEYGRRVCEVRPFAVARHLCSNGEFYEFVVAGGYTQRRHWSDEGWRWRQHCNAMRPSFWVACGPEGLHRYALRTCFEHVEMPWSWPVIVNYHEAQAYCAFQSERQGGVALRLLTEAEHNYLRDPEGPSEQRDCNLALAGWSTEAPVDRGPVSRHGVRDLFGNVWEWCEDDFNPLPGFAVDPLYADFSTPCFDGAHRMILGGSFISIGDEASPHARFHFRPHFFQHAGFRVVRPHDSDLRRDAIRLGDPQREAATSYESGEMLEQYLLLHHGDVADQVPEGLDLAGLAAFPQRCAALLAKVARERSVALDRALDVGCAVGGASFELARSFAEVRGIDWSASFIAAANHIRASQRVELFVREEGELGRHVTRTLELDGIAERVSFARGDACRLDAELGDFDAILAANLLCRLADPRAFLARVADGSLLRRGGLLALMSPYSWAEVHTPRQAWLGGRADADTPSRSRAGVLAALGREFELVHEQDVPLLIREHGRKFQLIRAHAMVLQRCRT